MRIACFFIGWQIESDVRKTIEHYREFCRDVTFLDNYSDDLSAHVAKLNMASVRPFGIRGVLDDREYTKVKNNIWRGMDYDYVIICDSDEILYHPDLAAILEQEKAIGTTIFRTQGYSMFSNENALRDWKEIQTGYPDDKYSKLVIFDPKAITDIDYVYGSHVAKPKGRLVWSQSTIPLLHYMGVGGAERMIERHKLYASRLSEFNRRWNCGIEYTYSAESKRQWFKEQLEKSYHLQKVGEPFY